MVPGDFQMAMGIDQTSGIKRLIKGGWLSMNVVAHSFAGDII